MWLLRILLVARSGWPRKHTVLPIASFSSVSSRNRSPIIKMNTAYFHWQDADGVVDITLHFVCEHPPVNKVFNFKRQVDELIDTTLNRMKANVDKEVQKKAKSGKAKSNKKKKASDGEATTAGAAVCDEEKPPASDDAEEAAVKVLLLNATGDVITGISWTELFIGQPELHRQAVLRVKNVDFALAFNYPHVSRIELPTCLLVGYDCFPTKLDLQFTSRDECDFVWFRGLPKPNHENAVKDIRWTRCGEGYIYRMQPEDAGHKFKVPHTLSSVASER